MIKLLGVLIVIVGFALKMDSILIVVAAALTTAFVGGLGIDGLLETLGTSFVANRSMSIFIVTMLVTGTLERNGLKEVAAALIGKIKNATSGVVIAAHTVLRVIFAAFNISFGGVVGFIRPVIMPMAYGAVEATGNEVNPEHYEKLKGLATGSDNVSNFFGQVVFIGGSGALLVQSTLAGLGYTVDLVELAKVEIPVVIFATVLYVVYSIWLDKKMVKKYYGNAKKTK